MWISPDEKIVNQTNHTVVKCKLIEYVVDAKGSWYEY